MVGPLAVLGLHALAEGAVDHQRVADQPRQSSVEGLERCEAHLALEGLARKLVAQLDRGRGALLRQGGRARCEGVDKVPQQPSLGELLFAVLDSEPLGKLKRSHTVRWLQACSNEMVQVERSDPAAHAPCRRRVLGGRGG